MKIILLGYMGSGKSTVGRAVAAQSGLQFIDLDDYIEAAENQPISAIFSEKGELYFRNLEHHYLTEILDQKTNVVLATGGGTPCYGKNMEVIEAATNNVFYLKVSINGLVDRLLAQKSQRPLIKDLEDSELPEFIGKHLFERIFFYSRARHVVLCDKRDPTAIAKEILTLSI